MHFLSANPHKYKQKRRPVFPTGRFLKKSNEFLIANYRRLPVLFRRPPPSKQILSVNLHYHTILPHLPLFVNP
jgi:hypothetical protein